MISDKFNIEEINLIHACKSRELNALISELYRHKKSAGPDMAEIIERTILKLFDTTPAYLQEILDYPAENEGI